MRIENPTPLQDLDFPINTEGRVEIYKTLGKPLYEALEMSELGTAFLKLRDVSKRNVDLIKAGVRYHIAKESGDPYYKFHTKVLTDPKDTTHRILIFSKKPWDEVVWEEVSSKLK